MPGVSNSDKATERDFFNSARDICEAGLSSPAGNGGLQVLGEHNNLVIFVYAKDSEYDNSFDRSHGCVRRGRDRVFYMLSQFGFFVRTCTPAEEEEAASSPSTDDASDFGTSPVGTVNAADDPEAHPASTGCMGLQPLQAGVAEILYGLKAAVKKVNGWLFRSCRSAVLEITKP
ncbi:MAG: hypothetical protein M1836_005464 [Candelina mexicana]|nr:MAG: hypothetical protein M1836_005464 [Candelina mexicana]